MKARVRNDCRRLGNVIVHRDMEKYFGKVLEFVHDDSNERGWYRNLRVLGDTFTWRWHESWLDFIPAPVEVHKSEHELKGFYFMEGCVNYWVVKGIVFATIRMHQPEQPVYNCVFSGHAICNDSDTFSLAEGIKVACKNALEFWNYVPFTCHKESKREAKVRVTELMRRRAIYGSIRNVLRGGLV